MPYIKISFDCLSCGEVDCKCPDKKHDLECHIRPEVTMDFLLNISVISASLIQLKH